MTVNYTSLLGLALPVTGTEAGAWGDVVNNYLTSYLDASVAGTQTITGSQTAVTLAVTNGATLVTVGSGATGSAQFQIITCTGNPASLLTITAPASSRQYIIINSTSTSQSVKIVGAGPTTGVTIVSGEKAHVAWNGSDFVKIATQNGNGDFVTVDTTNLEVTNIKAKDGTASMTLADSTGVVTFSKATVIEATDNTNAALRITQLGTGNALLVEDSANPDSSPFVVTATGDVGIGTSSPTGYLANKLVIATGTDSNNGITIASATNRNGSVWFADGTTGSEAFRGGVDYQHTTDTLYLYSGGLGNFQLSAAGNIGLGVTPSAWRSGTPAFQIGSAGVCLFADSGIVAGLGNNMFLSSASQYVYLRNDLASRYQQYQGVHSWLTAGSGIANTTTITNLVSYTIITSGNQTDFGAPNNTPGTSFTANSSGTLSSGTVSQNIVFATAMTLLANGNLGIGETNPAARLEVSSSGSSGRILLNGADLPMITNGYDKFTSGSYNGAGRWGLFMEPNALTFGLPANAFATFLWKRFNADSSVSSTSMTLDASGNLGLGVTPSAWASTHKAYQLPGGGGLYNNGADGYLNLANNFYYDGADWRRVTAAPASTYLQSSSGHLWGYVGTGTANSVCGFPSAQMALDTSGNLGLGVTPSASWNNIFKAIQIGSSSYLSVAAQTTATARGSILWNAIGSGDESFVYRNTGDPANRFMVGSGFFAWYTAGNGTAGNAISFTQAMTLSATSGPALRVGVTADLAGFNFQGANQVGFSVHNSGSSATAAYFSAANNVTLTSAGNFAVINGVDGILFGASAAERARITSGGYFKASNNGTYADSTGGYHEFYQTNNTDTVRVTSTSTAVSGAYGVYVDLTTDPNATDSFFLRCYGGANQRASIRSNGGLANYQANDVNLSDQRVKKDIVAAPSYWDKIKGIEIVHFKYKDQTHDDNNVGVIAQQVEQVAPEFVDQNGWGDTPEDGVPLKSIYTSDMYHAAIKALQEAMARIEKLEAEVAALKGA